MQVKPLYSVLLWLLWRTVSFGCVLEVNSSSTLISRAFENLYVDAKFDQRSFGTKLCTKLSNRWSRIEISALIVTFLVVWFNRKWCQVYIIRGTIMVGYPRWCCHGHYPKVTISIFYLGVRPTSACICIWYHMYTVVVVFIVVLVANCQFML